MTIRPEKTEYETDPKGVFSDIRSFEQQLQKSSEEELAFYWKARNTLDKAEKYKVRAMIWKECMSRYETDHWYD